MVAWLRVPFLFGKTDIYSVYDKLLQQLSTALTTADGVRDQGPDERVSGQGCLVENQVDASCAFWLSQTEGFDNWATQDLQVMRSESAGL